MAGQTPDLSNITADVAGKNTLAGIAISINLKRNSFFGVGDIDLTPKRYWAIVSDGMPPDYYKIISGGLQKGLIVKGKVFIPPVDQDQRILDDATELFRIHGKNDLTVKYLQELISKGGEGGWSLKEIVVHILKTEKNGLHRPDVVGILEAALKYVDPRYRDPDVIEETEGKITVTKRADGSMTITRDGEAPKSPEEYMPPPPEGHVPGTNDPNEALGELLE